LTVSFLWGAYLGGIPFAFICILIGSIGRARALPLLLQAAFTAVLWPLTAALVLAVRFGAWQEDL
jgi:isoprenylcysteine carboxyl methyltransferase (ICMT) family protein YpbQ